MKGIFPDSLVARLTAITPDSSITARNFSAQALLLQQVRVLRNSLPNPVRMSGRHRGGLEEKYKASLFKVTSADLSDNLTSTPLMMPDSSETILQNSLQGNFSFAVDGRYGFTGYLLYRRTIAGPLPDFFDFHIGYSGRVPSPGLPNSPLTKEGLRRAYAGHNVFDSALQAIRSKAAGLKGITSLAGVEGKVLSAREVIGNHSVDSSYQFTDPATVAAAKRLLEWYDGVEKNMAGLQRDADSIRMIRDRFAAVLGGSNNLNELIASYATRSGVVKMFADSMPGLRQKDARLSPSGTVTKFGLGRVFPYQSELTLKNNSLRGTDLRYEYGRYIVAASAGLIDFQLSGLLRKRKVEKPLPYAVVLYAGYKLLPHLTAGFRYFNGRKDNYGAGIRRATLQGTAFEVTYSGQGKMVSFELAKNISQPSFTSGAVPQKSFWDVGDRENMAISARSSLYIRRTRTTIDASYSAQGKYYNAFNTYSSNTQTKKYDVKISQNLWSGAIRISGWLRNTEFTPSLNGILLQNEVSLKSFNISFRKTGWPLTTVGYNPVKQTFISDSSVQLAIYHALSFFTAYNYRLGIRPASVSLSLNRLGGREAAGQGQTYLGNSTNILLDNRMDFQGYASLLNISYMGSKDFLLLTAGSGLVVNVSGGATVKAGITINSFNHNGSKAGGNLGFQMPLGGRGAAGIDYNLSYLPAISGKTLMRYNYGNINFRYSLVK